ncbi:organic cation/carnitine transporter 3, partial [Quercus suber]|uniref:organic cation/carnitine transporter 3 n=1 Tax=Quercus suber TaxID=58331 RepID=UPI0032DE8E62
WAFKRLSPVMVIAFGIGMVYYGMPLGLGNLPFNLYLSVTFNALSEIPSSLFTILLIGKLNRKFSVLAFTTISGIFSIMCALKGKEWARLQIGFELVSFFSACFAFSILLIFTIELFPTSVRNSATSLVRQALVLGGVFSPMLVAAERRNGISSYVVFGLVIGCCGLFAACLPETRGRALCDTMDEEEHRESSLILLIFTIELFPTSVRNSATSLVRQALVLGGVFSPMLVAAERRNGISSYVVFGLVIGCCGLFAACLPETRGRALCDTMDEEEHRESSL